MKVILTILALSCAALAPSIAAEKPTSAPSMEEKRISQLNYPNAEATVTSGSMKNTQGVSSVTKTDTPNGPVWHHEVLMNGAKIVWTCTPLPTGDLYEITVTRNGNAEEGSFKYSGSAKSVTVGEVEFSVK